MLRAMGNGELDGRDLESRAHLYRVVQQAAALHRLLVALPPAAAKRAGMGPGVLDEVNRLASRALWASTADLHQRGEDELAERVVARALDLTTAEMDK